MADKIQTLLIMLVLSHLLVGMFYSKELIEYPLLSISKKVFGILYLFLVPVLGALWVREAVKMEKVGDLAKESEASRSSPDDGTKIYEESLVSG